MDRCFHQSVRVLGIPPGGVLGRAVPIIADIFGDVYPQIQRNTQKVKLYITMWPTTSNYMEKQECIPVGWVPTACWLYPILSHVSWGGGHPSRCRPPGYVTCDTCWEAIRPPPVNRMRHRCKNITLRVVITDSLKSNTHSNRGTSEIWIHYICIKSQLNSW